MTKKDARKLQELSGGSLSHRACENLLLEHGFEKAQERVIKMAKLYEAKRGKGRMMTYEEVVEAIHRGKGKP